MVALTAEERKKFCDREFYQLALVLMSNDSASMTFLKDRTLLRQFDSEFKASHEFMIAEVAK